MTDFTRLMALYQLDNKGALNSIQKMAVGELRNRWGDFKGNINRVVEPALAMGTGMAGQAVGGLAGLGGLALGAGNPQNVDAAANVSRKVQEAMTYQPRTPEGLQGLQALSNAGEGIANKVNTAAGIGSGLATYQATGDIEQAANVGGQVYDKGFGQAAGDYVTDKTGSPLLGTAAYMIPSAIDAVAGTKLAGKIPGKQFEMGDISGQAFGQKGTFGGIRAKNADLPAKAKAEQMTTDGASRDEVWAETGWFKDVDDSWKFEIDDSQALAGDPRVSTGVYGDTVLKDVRLGEAVVHPELFDQYDIGNTTVGLEPKLTSEASYSPALDNISLKHRGGKYIPDAETIAKMRQVLEKANIPEARIKEMIDNKTKGVNLISDENKSALLHETQHSIQGREGFAVGGSSTAGHDSLIMSKFGDKGQDALEANFELKLMDEAKQAVISGDDSSLSHFGKQYADQYRTDKKGFDKSNRGFKKSIKNIVGDNSEMKAALDKHERVQGKSDFELYQRLAGEAEARNVQTRLDMTPEQRRAKPPWQTLDVPENELIVRK